MLKKGDRLPALTVTLEDGSRLPLAGLGRPLVLFFFPAAFTPLCTAQACAFRDSYEGLQGAQVVGISPDPLEKLQDFRAQNHFPFPLASDAENEVARAFRILPLNGLLPFRARSTFVFDSEGLCLGSYHNELSAAGHVNAAKKLLAS